MSYFNVITQKSIANTMSKNIDLLSFKPFETLRSLVDTKKEFDINLCSVLAYFVTNLEMTWPLVYSIFIHGSILNKEIYWHIYNKNVLFLNM